MADDSTRHWGRWVAAIAGVFVAFKTTVFVVTRAFSFTKHEMAARGSDAAFVLGLAERRKRHA